MARVLIRAAAISGAHVGLHGCLIGPDGTMATMCLRAGLSNGLQRMAVGAISRTGPHPAIRQTGPHRKKVETIHAVPRPDCVKRLATGC